MPNFTIIIIGIITVMMLLHHSAKHNEDQWRAHRAQQTNPPEHEIVDNQPSGSVWAFCILFVIAFCLLSMATR